MSPSNKEAFVNPQSGEENRKLGELFEPLCQFEPGDDRRAPHANAILDHLHKTGVAENWALNLSRRFFMLDEIDDIRQIVMESIIEFLHQVDKKAVRRIHALFLPHLFHTARHAVQAYQESGRRTGMAGMSTLVRRQKEIVRGRVELASQGHENATDAEVRDHVNAKMLKKRADAHRQGALVTDTDFTAGSVLMADPGYMSKEYSQQQEDEQQTRLEADEAVRALIRHLRNKYPEDKAVLRCAMSWMRCILIGETPKFSIIAEETGYTEAQVEKSMTKMRRALTGFREMHAS